MAKKIIMGICISIILAGFSWFFINGEFDSSAITVSSYDIVVGTEAGDVIQQGDTIINLARLEEFYKNKSLKQVAVSIDRNPVSML